MTKQEQILGSWTAAEDLIRQALAAIDVASEAAGRSEEGRILAVARTDLEKVESWLTDRRERLDPE